MKFFSNSPQKQLAKPGYDVSTDDEGYAIVNRENSPKHKALDVSSPRNIRKSPSPNLGELATVSFISICGVSGFINLNTKSDTIKLVSTITFLIAAGLLACNLAHVSCPKEKDEPEVTLSSMQF